MIDALHLARAQFGFTVALHIIFPAFSIGLASYLAVLETLWLWTGMVNSIAPTWDGNETWLVLDCGGLLAAFPLAYAVILPALYSTILGMLFGLIFRGVAFEL